MLTERSINILFQFQQVNFNTFIYLQRFLLTYDNEHPLRIVYPKEATIPSHRNLKVIFTVKFGSVLLNDNFENILRGINR